MSINPFPSTIVSFTIVMLITGVVVGLVVGGPVWANPSIQPDTASAQALSLDRTLETAYHWQEWQAGLEASIEKNKQELAAAQERHDREVALIELRAQLVNSLLQIVTAAVLLAVLIASSGLAYYLACLGRSRLLAAQAQAAAQVNWKDELQRADAVRLAREAEQVWRAAQQPAGNGNGHHHTRLARLAH